MGRFLVLARYRRPRPVRCCWSDRQQMARHEAQPRWRRLERHHASTARRGTRLAGQSTRAHFKRPRRRRRLAPFFRLMIPCVVPLLLERAPSAASYPAGSGAFSLKESLPTGRLAIRPGSRRSFVAVPNDQRTRLGGARRRRALRCSTGCPAVLGQNDGPDPLIAPSQRRGARPRPFRARACDLGKQDRQHYSPGRDRDVRRPYNRPFVCPGRFADGEISLWILRFFCPARSF